MRELDHIPMKELSEKEIASVIRRRMTDEQIARLTKEYWLQEALSYADTADPENEPSASYLRILAHEFRRLRSKHEAAIQKLRDTADYLEKETAQSSIGYALGCREAIRLLS